MLLMLVAAWATCTAYQPNIISRLNHGIVFEKTKIAYAGENYWDYIFIVEKIEIPSLPWNNSILCPTEDTFPSSTSGKILSETCRKYKTTMIQYGNFRNTMTSQIANMIDDINHLLPAELKKHRGGKRALFGFVSTISKYLFGTPSEEDIKRAETKISLLSETAANQQHLVEQNSLDLISLANISNVNMINIKKQQEDNRKKFVELINSLHGWRTQLTSKLSGVQGDLIQLVKTYSNMNIMNQMLSLDLLLVAKVEAEAEAFISDIQTLAERYLPLNMVGPSKVAEALRIIQERLGEHSDLKLVWTDISSYYKVKNIDAIQTNSHIFINMRVQLANERSTMQVFNIHKFYFNMRRDKKTHQVSITNIARKIAITMDRKYYALIYDDHELSCTRNMCRVHTGLRAMETASCELEILNGNTITLDGPCTYSMSQHDKSQTMAHLIKDDHVILSSEHRWVIDCPQSQIAYLPPCQLCEIKLPCNCQIYSKEIAIMSSNAECSPTKELNITVKYAVNIPTMLAFYENTKFHGTNQHASTDDPIELTLPADLLIADNIPDHTLMDIAALKEHHKQGIEVTRMSIERMVEGITRAAEVPVWVTYTTAAVLSATIAISTYVGYTFYQKLAHILVMVNTAQTVRGMPVHYQYQRSEGTDSHVDKLLYGLYAILTICLVFRLIQRIRSRCIRRNIIIDAGLKTSILLVLDSNNDRIGLIMETLHKIPQDFARKDIRIRSISNQPNGCYTQQAIIEWYNPSGTLFIRDIPFLLPSSVPIPIYLTRRANSIINNQHEARVMVAYDGITYEIPPVPEKESMLSDTEIKEHV